MVKAEHLCTLEISLDPPLEIGKVPEGERRVIPINGGTFSCRINGEIIPGGADWNIVKPDGTINSWARYTLKTDDGAIIMITNDGYQPGDPEVMGQILTGEEIDVDKMYAWSRPMFEVAHEKYAFLNTQSFVGTLVPKGPLDVRVIIYEIV